MAKNKKKVTAEQDPAGGDAAAEQDGGDEVVADAVHADPNGAVHADPDGAVHVDIAATEE